MRRLILAGLFTLVLAYSSSAPAFALWEVEWCEWDPVLVVDGHRSDVKLFFPLEYKSTLTAPVTFVFHVPQGSQAHASYPKNQGPQSVSITYDGPARSGNNGKSGAPVVVTVDASVSAPAVFQTRTVVLVAHQAPITKLGTSNATTSITYTLAR
jgi:hypothetical protein